MVCFPELGLTGYACADLFLQYATLLRGAERALEELIAETKDLDLLACVGVPVRVRGKLCDCAAVFSRGELLGLVCPRRAFPSSTEFYEGRWFTGGAAFGDAPTSASPTPGRRAWRFPPLWCSAAPPSPP